MDPLIYLSENIPETVCKVKEMKKPMCRISDCYSEEIGITYNITASEFAGNSV